MKIATRFANFLNIQQEDIVENLNLTMDEFREHMYRMFHEDFDEEILDNPPNALIVFTDMSAVGVVFNIVKDRTNMIVATFDDAFDSLDRYDLIKGVTDHVNHIYFLEQHVR